MAAAALGFTAPASAASATFASNSLIIPMDTTSQNQGMWKAYGLVYRLLQGGVPVHWAIGNPKVPSTFTGTDFTSGAAVIQRLGTTTVVSPYTYTGGPFIIDSADSAAAQAIITAWWAANANQPVVHVITAGSVTANVDLVLHAAPRIALEQSNAGIAIAYFKAANIPDGSGAVWSTSSKNVLNVGLIACNNSSASTCPNVLGDSALFQGGACTARRYDVFVTPHNSGYSFSTTDPTNVGTQAYAELDNFVTQGGGWLALCHSILSNENNISTFYALPATGATAAVRALFKSQNGGGFLTTGGFPVISNRGTTWLVDAPNLPIAQSVATTVANGLPGGSVQTWPSPLSSPPIAGAPTYWPATEVISHFEVSGAKYDFTVNGAAHNGNAQGKVTFIGGHSYSTSLPYSSNNDGPYLRFFYNALFFNGAAVADMRLVPSATSVPQATATAVQLALTNAGGGVATNVGQNGGVTITLVAGVSFVSMASGPAPAVASGPGGTTILTWGALGDVAAGATVLAVNTSVTLPTVGSVQIASITARYSDVYGESFAQNACSAINVLPTPGPTIAKTPATIGPANVGDIITWTLSYSNQGSGNLLNPFVEDVLPSSFGFVSATPAPTSIVPVAGGTRLRWTLASPMAPGGSGSITLRAAVQTAIGQPFTNTATLTGTDATGAQFSGTSSSQVSVATPQAQIRKSVSPTGSVLTGTTLTYTLAPSSPGPALLTDVRFFDPPPANTTYVNGSANQGGTFGAYTPLAATQGADPGPDPQTTMDLTYSAASPFTQALGSTITVTMALRNATASSGPITNVTASLSPRDGASTCVPLSAQPVASIPNTNTPVNITFTCTIETFAEVSWDGNASGTFNGADYQFVGGTSATVLGVPTTTGTNVVKWIGMGADTSTPPVPSVSFAAGTAPGVFAFDGTTALWERFDVGSSTWAKSPAPGGLTNNLPGNTGPGAAMVYDGNGFANGFVYAFQGGGSNAFWRYKLSDGTTGVWSLVTVAPWPVNAGGALTVLGPLIYGLQGNNLTGFASYNATSNSWTALAPLPAGARIGASLATDGTNIYALIGGGKNSFYRYNVASNTWTAQANFPWGANNGSSLVAVGTTLYGTQANGNKGFATFVPSATTTGKWTKIANLPQNVKAGAGLTTDGTTIWATQGNNQRGFFAFNVKAGTWSTSTSLIDNVTNGGALEWVPGAAGATNTTALSAPVLETGSLAAPATIQVVMTITSSTAVSGISPTALTIASSNATPPATLAASCTVSPSTPQSIGAGGSLTFTWTCTNAYATGTTLTNTLGALTFSAGATGTAPATTWGMATSNSVLITQPLTYMVAVNSGTGFTQVSNQALLSDSGGFTAGVGSNVVTNSVQQAAAVTVAKSVSPTGQVSPGATLTYTLAVQATTSNPTANVVVTDAVPAGTTFLSCATTLGTCSLSAGMVTYNLGNIGPYGAATLTMTVTVGTPAAAGTSTISDTASYTLNGGASTPTNTVSNTVLATPAVAISKAQAATTDANGAVAPGATITYTLTVTNPVGAVTATNVTISDAIPPNTDFVSCNGAGCTQSAGTVTWTLGSLAPGSSVPVTLVVTVSNPALSGDTIADSATVSADDGQGGAFTSESNIVSLPVVAAPIVTAIKSASPPSGSTVNPGDTITYTIAITNTGNANDDTVTLDDFIPAGTTYVDGSTTLNGNTVTVLTKGIAANGSMHIFSCGGADPAGDGGTLFTQSAPLQPGCSTNVATVTFQVTVNSGFSGTITNFATISTGSAPPFNTNTTTHASGADLTIAKTVNNATPVVGSTVTFTVTVQNTGPGDAAGVSVSDQLPSGYSLVSATPSVGSYNAGTGVWTIGPLANGASATLTLNAIVLPSGSYINTATATSTTFDPTTPNTASAGTTPVAVADVTTTVSPPATAPAGSAVIVPITFSNDGPSTAAGVTYTVTLPPGLSGVTCSGGGVTCSYDSTTGAVTVTGLPTSLASGESVDFTLSYTAPPSGTVTVNTAISTTTNQGANVAPDTASGVTTITPVADLTVSKSSSPNPYVPGATLTYTVVVSNAGPSGVTGAQVVDTLPAPLAAFTWTCTPAPPAACGAPSGSGNINTTVDLPAGGHVTFSITGTVPPGTTGTFTNTVTVTAPAGTTDPVPGNNQATDNNPVGPKADLVITKSSSPQPYVPGAALTYTITVSNEGPSDATNARVQDALPAPLAGFGWTCTPSAPATCGTAAGTGNIDTLVTLPAGSHVTFHVTGTVPSGTSVGLSNTATVTPPLGTTDPVPGNNQATDNNPVGPQADLSVTKSSSPKPYVPGAALTYAIVVSNAGPSDVANARVQDVLPAPLSGFTWTCTPSAPASCGTTSGTGDVDALVTLPAGSHVGFTITGTVPPGTVGALINTVTVTPPANTTDPVPGNNQATDINPIGAQADLSVTKSSAPNPYVPGTALTYTITASNAGPSDATNARVQDTLPAPLAGFTWTCTPTAPATCGTASGTGSIDELVTLPAGSHVTFSVTGTVPSATSGTLTNTVTVTPPLSANDPIPGNNQATNSTSEAAQADLVMTKTVSNPTPNVGTDVTFTLTAHNNGPSDAAGVSVSDPLPSGYSFVSATASVGGYDPATGTWTVGPLANGATATLDVTVTVLASGSYANTATASSSTPDPNTANNTASAVTTPGALADLVMSKTVSDPTPTVGDQITFHLTVLNSGPSDAAGVFVSEGLASGFSFVSAVASAGTYDPGTGTWTVGTLANGANATLAITVTVLANGNYSNTAHATSSTPDPDPTNNTASVVATPGASADLALGKTVSNPAPNVGGDVTFTLTVHNNGPSAANDVVVNDPLSSGYSFVSATASVGSYDPGTGAWTVGVLASGVSATLDITATVLATGVHGNSASASSSTPDPDPSNNTASVTTTPQPVADLAISKSSSPQPYVPGATLTYTIVVSNAGPSGVTAAPVVDTLPAPLSAFTWTCTPASPAACGAPSGSGNINTTVDLPAASHVTFSITGIVPPGTSGAFTNTATVTPPAGTTDPVPGNNQATDNNPVGPQADLVITKSSSPNPYVPGAALTYAVVVSNAGPSDATNARVQDTLPAPLAAFGWTCTPSAPAACGTPSGTGNIDALVTLPAGSHVTFSITGTVPPGTSGGLTNTATVAPPPGTTDPVPGNNQATNNNPVGPQADLAVTKSSAPNPYVPGTTLAYTIVVSNAGPSGVTNARVQDVLPAPLAGFGWTCTPTAPGTCGTASGTGNIDALVTLPAGSHVTFSITGTVPPGTLGTLTNTVTVTPPAGTIDPVPGNNQATDNNPVGPQADLAVTKSSAPNPYVPGAAVTYTITVSNAGPSTATNARVQDVLPAPLAGFTWACTPSAPATCASASGTGNIDALVTLPAGSHVAFSVTGTVPPSTHGTLTNTVTVTAPAGITDPNPANNQATDSSSGAPQADLVMSKTVNNPTPNVNSNVVFTLTVHNDGPSAASNVVVNEHLSSGFSFVSAIASVGSYDPGAGVWTVGTLANGATATLNITATVLASGDYTNTASVSSSTFDPNPGNDSTALTIAPGASGGFRQIPTLQAWELAALFLLLLISGMRRGKSRRG